MKVPGPQIKNEASRCLTEANTIEQMILDAVGKGEGTDAKTTPKWDYVSGRGSSKSARLHAKSGRTRLKRAEFRRFTRKDAARLTREQ
jgi:hypothetical protein